jgi:hypothetical protein
VLCSKCGIGVYVRQDRIPEDDSLYCAYCEGE